MKCLFVTLVRLFILLVISVSSINVSHSQNMDFKTDGLYNAEFFDNIYRGHFENIEMNREDLEFLSIFEQYLRAYGRQCPDLLPADKVKIMNTECAREQVTTNGYGLEISRVCVEWRQVPSGLYARRELYNAKLEVERIHSADALRELVGMMTDQNIMGNTLDKAHKAKALMLDMGQLFNLNPCNGLGIKRFEKNLRMYALNQPSVRMQGVSKYTAMKKTGGPIGLQDFNKLINDLVADQAKTWMFNRFTQESISGVTILAKDSQGRPATIIADYRYSGFSGTSKGWVKVIFANGLPKGIYFFDFPDNRKTPGSSIVASYAKGTYSK